MSMRPVQRFYSKFKEMSWGEHTMHSLAAAGLNSMADSGAHLANNMTGYPNHAIQLAGNALLGGSLVVMAATIPYMTGHTVAGVVKLVSAGGENEVKPARGLQPR